MLAATLPQCMQETVPKRHLLPVAVFAIIESSLPGTAVSQRDGLLFAFFGRRAIMLASLLED
jgi:hypothetical protein